MHLSNLIDTSIYSLVVLAVPSADRGQLTAPEEVRGGEQQPHRHAATPAGQELE